MDYLEEFREVIELAKKGLMVYEEMGMDPPPVSRKTLDAISESAKVTVSIPEDGSRIKTLEQLRNYIGDCKRCPLHQGRKHLVFGEGDPTARLVFVGEGPGRAEDEAGRPFVGEAGRLLTRIIENGMGLSRDEVYICNVVKCRPPGNRDPKEDEIRACLPFLKHQLAIIRPQVICILGSIAGKALLGDHFRIKRDRGKWFEYMGIPVMPTFHPAYLLRNPGAKRAVWDDIKEIMKNLGLRV